MFRFFYIIDFRIFETLRVNGMCQSDSSSSSFVCNEGVAGIRQLFDRYYRPLVLYADEYLKDRCAAEDLVQELFVRLCENNHLLNVPDTAVPAYLYSAVRNRCISYHQKKDVLRGTKELDGVDIPVELVSGVDEDQMERVISEVEKLPERTRQVVECVMLKGMKYKEAANELNISVNTVKFSLREGTKRLRERLKAFGPNVFFFFLLRIRKRV